MHCLLYGIVLSDPQSRAGPPTSLPAGVGGAPVSLIEVGQVAAVVGTIDRAAALTPTVGSVVAYARVVEALHAGRAVLPMRFGCVLDRKADVARLLCERGHIYVEVLRELEGCVEMGIRMLACKAERGTGRIPVSEQRDFIAEAPAQHAGADYLAERKRAYADADRHVHDMTTLAERICAALHGLYVRCTAENGPAAARSASSTPLFSIDFLVRRESLDGFRQIFHRISRVESARLLLTGPWPPYNFVEPASLLSFMAPTQ